MSTYLLAFMVANYSARGNESELAVLTRPEFYDNTEFSYHVGEQVVSAYGELFQSPYAELGNDVLQYASSPRFPAINDFFLSFTEISGEKVFYLFFIRLY